MPFERFILVAVIIGLALLLALVGVVLAWYQRKKTPAAHAAVPDDKPASSWVKNLAGSTGKTLTRTGDPNLPADAVVLLRDAVSGEWMVELNGMQYTALKDVHDDRAASKVLEALGGFQVFAGIAPIANPDLKAKPVILPTPSAPAPGLNPAVAMALTQSGPAPSLPLYPAPPNSIVAQIETILQRNLMRYPELSERKIHVGAAADGSLLFEVDRQLYGHVEDIAELQVRDLIKAAIHEWERTA
jgi:hypothetical protein